MPGGRGTILDIAGALNRPKHKKIAKAIKMAINQGDYDVQASVSLIGAAYDHCDHTKELTDVWCEAVERGRVDWSY